MLTESLVFSSANVSEYLCVVSCGHIYFADADFQQAFSLTVQVMNTVTVPQGDQYGTDSGSGEC